MKIDVREDKELEITEIVFADKFEYNINAIYLPGSGKVRVSNSYSTGSMIGSKEDALNLIKALNKAIDLGWFDKD